MYNHSFIIIVDAKMRTEVTILWFTLVRFLGFFAYKLVGQLGEPFG